MNKLAILFFLPFALVGLVTGSLTIRHLGRSLATSDWVEVPGHLTFVDLKVESQQTSDGTSTSYHLNAKYHYSYLSREYSGTQVNVGDQNGFGLVAKSRAKNLNIIKESGSPCPVWVNPDKPEEALLFRAPVWDYLAFLSVFVFIFGGVGFGGIIFLFVSRKKDQIRKEKESLHRDQPWLWDDKWDRGIAYGGNLNGAIVMWVFALFWNSVSSPILFVFQEEWNKGNKLIVIGLLFPLVGIILLFFAFRKTWQWKKFGRCRFHMDTFPGVIGGNLNGSVIVPACLELLEPLSLTLNCGKWVTTGSGKNRSRSLKLLWQSEKTLDGDQLFPGAETIIPIHFGIPYSCRATSQSEEIQWNLHIRAEVPGVDFATEFEVPVFQTSTSNPDITEKNLPDLQPTLQARPPLTKIEISYPEADSLKMVTPTLLSRNLGSTLGLFLFTVIWTGMIVLMVHLGAPLLFPIVFGFFDLLLLIGLLSAFFYSCTVILNPQGILVTHSILFWNFPKHYNFNAIGKIDFKQSGSQTVGNKQTAQYKVYAETPGRSIILASGISNKNTARWLVHEWDQHMEKLKK